MFALSFILTEINLFYFFFSTRWKDPSAFLLFLQSSPRAFQGSEHVLVLADVRSYWSWMKAHYEQASVEDGRRRRWQRRISSEEHAPVLSAPLG